MRIGIVEDEKIQLDLLVKICNEYAVKNNINLNINTFNSCEELLFDLEDNNNYDAFFLDIQMKNMNGMELAHKLRSLNNNTLIAFISGVKEYVFEGYEVNAISYILKPYNEIQIGLLIDKIHKITGKTKTYLVIKTSKQVFKIPHEHIYTIEASGHNCIINNKDEISMGINELYKELPNYFVKTHRSIIVNIQHVVKVLKTCCILSNNEEVIIARGSYEKVMQEFIKYNKE